MQPNRSDTPVEPTNRKATMSTLAAPPNSFPAKPEDETLFDDGIDLARLFASLEEDHEVKQRVVFFAKDEGEPQIKQLASTSEEEARALHTSDSVVSEEAHSHEAVAVGPLPDTTFDEILKQPSDEGKASAKNEAETHQRQISDPSICIIDDKNKLGIPQVLHEVPVRDLKRQGVSGSWDASTMSSAPDGPDESHSDRKRGPYKRHLRESSSQTRSGYTGALSDTIWSSQRENRRNPISPYAERWIVVNEKPQSSTNVDPPPEQKKRKKSRPRRQYTRLRHESSTQTRNIHSGSESTTQWGNSTVPISTPKLRWLTVNEPIATKSDGEDTKASSFRKGDEYN